MATDEATADGAAENASKDGYYTRAMKAVADYRGAAKAMLKSNSTSIALTNAALDMVTNCVQTGISLYESVIALKVAQFQNIAADDTAAAQIDEAFVQMMQNFIDTTNQINSTMLQDVNNTINQYSSTLSELAASNPLDNLPHSRA